MPTPRPSVAPSEPAAAPPSSATAPPPRKSPHAWALEKLGQDTPKGRKLTPAGAFRLAGVLHTKRWIEDDQIAEADFDQAVAEFLEQKVER